VRAIVRNINLGKDLEIKDNVKERWKRVFLIAIGQGKMTKRPVSGILHIMVYAGFILVNIEMLEIMIDGIAGTHRFFSFLFELFALSVIAACIIFLIRRNILRVKRFHTYEMKSWPLIDANIILFTEILLMTALFFMNAADQVLQTRGLEHYVHTGPFLFSSVLIPLLVFLSFPNVYYAKLKPATYISNMEAITNEVKVAMGVLGAPEDYDGYPRQDRGGRRASDRSKKGSRRKKNPAGRIYLQRRNLGMHHLQCLY